ncbi:MAG: small basic protein [Phycisphaerales bacterium]|nr:small basic protein [Phycisphaerales bacterium]
MSLHSSLKTKSGALNQHRNVLTRAERVEALTSKERFDPTTDSPIGMVKVASRKTVVKKKPSKAAAAAAAAEEESS